MPKGLVPLTQICPKSVCRNTTIKRAYTIIIYIFRRAFIKLKLLIWPVSHITFFKIKYKLSLSKVITIKYKLF